jgi:hypothetical protein
LSGNIPDNLTSRYANVPIGEGPFVGLGVIGLTTTSLGHVRDLWVLECQSVKSIGIFFMAAEAREK